MHVYLEQEMRKLRGLKDPRPSDSITEFRAELSF
jgi:hypothetical protein